MDRRIFTLGLLGAASGSLTGCLFGSGGDGVVVPVVPPGPLPLVIELATATSLPVATAFAQTVLATDGDGSVAPGQANFWDLNEDFSLDDGSDDQFDDALELEVEVAGNVETFPSDQTYAELTAFGPELGAADGVLLVSFSSDPQFVDSGTTSAVLHPVPNARLQQTLNLATAVAPINLTWSGSDRADNENFGDQPYFLQVVIRDAAGALLATIFRSGNSGGNTGAFGTGNLDAFAGQTVVLSFEQQSATDSSTVIDNVSVTDAVATQFVTNGDFEAGGTGWTVPVALVSQNVTSGVRTLNGLQVQRSFYTQPNQLWARWTDVFFNPGASEVTATVRYLTNLGSDDYGIIYDTPGAVGKALTTWDGDNSDRDVGLVFGSAASVTFVSDDGLGNGNGDDDITVTFAITVPAGGRVSLVNFIIMSGIDTADTAVDITARATEVDTLAADIANNLRTTALYQRGLTQQQIDTLANF